MTWERRVRVPKEQSTRALCFLCHDHWFQEGTYLCNNVQILQTAHLQLRGLSLMSKQKGLTTGSRINPKAGTHS